MRYIYSFIILYFFSINVQAISLKITPLVRFDLTNEAPIQAGEYLKKNYRSDKNTTLIDVEDISPEQSWVVCVRQPILLDGIKIRVKRTGKGVGLNKLSGKRSYKKPKKNKWTLFFSGKGERTQIPIQTKIKNIGVRDGYGIFKTQLEYKVQTYTDKESCD